MRQEHNGLFFALGTALISSVSALMIRWTPLPVPTILFFRFAICTLSVLPFLMQKKVIMTSVSIRKHCLRAICGLLSMGCFFYSINHLSVMNALTFSNTAPLFLPLVIFLWLKQIIPKIEFLALLIGFLGVIVILRPSENIHLIAAFIGLFGGLCGAFVQTGIRQLARTESTKQILTHYFVISCFVTFFPMIYYWEPISSPKLWMNLGILGLLALAMQYCYTKSLQHAGSIKVSAINYLAVPLGGGLGWWFFQETPSFWVLIGTCLILCGGTIAIFGSKLTKKNN